MDFVDRLNNLAKKVGQVSSSLATEEATKNALVMPFLHSILGYDIFDPSEVIPEFTADTATKKGEKVDYALIQDGKVQILIECKKYGEVLSPKHAGQLFRYFSVTDARFAVLTNGSVYNFYTDLDAPNRMDEKPFLVMDLENLDEHVIPEVKKFSKDKFSIDSIVDAAGELKYVSQIKRMLTVQFENPEDDFVKFFASRLHDGVVTSKVRAQFTEHCKKALKQFLNDKINDRLKSAISSSGDDYLIESAEIFQDEKGEPAEESKIVTTEEEIEGFNVIKAIFRQKIPVERVVPRDTQSYFGVLLDDNNRKPLCRLRFNAKQKYLGVFDENKNENRIPIASIDEIFNHTEALLKTINYYEVPSLD